MSASEAPAWVIGNRLASAAVVTAYRKAGLHIKTGHILPFALPASVALGLGGVFWHLAHDAERYRDELNASELFLYLREAYREEPGA
jgi:hypothetical protein